MPHPFERLLLASEHSEYDGGAEAVAFAIARRCNLPLAGVLPVLSNAEYEMVAPEQAARTDAQAAARRAALQASARAHGVAIDLRVRHGTELSAEIVAEARDRQSDLIVVRRRGKRGLLANLLVGEMVGKVVAQAPCSVLVAPRGAAMWQRRILAAVDPQLPDPAGVTQAAAIAAECGLPLQLTCVAADAQARADAERALADALALARALHPSSVAELRVGRTAETLVAAARESGADLLLIPRRSGAAQKLVGTAECPVLVHVPMPHEGKT